MRASGGIIAAALVAALGSVITFAFGAMLLAFALMHPEIYRSQGAAPWFITVILGFYLVLGVLGGWTSVDLFRLKAWARYSILVFSCFLALLAAVAALGTALIPLPNVPGPPGVVAGVRIFLIAFYATLFAIAIWWLVLFTRAGVKAQFRSGSGASSSRRPVSITVIACFLLIGVASLPLSIALHYPAVLFSFVITGWAAVAIYLVYGAALLYAAIGLLRLSETARKFTIIYLVISLFSGVLSWAVPGAFARAMQAMPRFGSAPPQIPFPVWLIAIPIAIVYGIVIAVLVRHQSAFHHKPLPGAQEFQGTT